MITNKIFNILLLFTLVFSFSCKKEKTKTSTNTIGSDFFIDGKGMRKIWGIQSERSGLGAFGINKMTITPDWHVHTVFTYANSNPNGAPADYVAYRRKINIATGDTVATNGIPKQVDITYIGQQQSGCLTFEIVPYTDKLVYYSGSQVYGNPNWQPMMFNQGFAKIYDSRQAACFSYFNVVAPAFSASFYSNAIASSVSSRYINPAAVSASAEITPSGDLISFIALKTDSLLVMDFKSNTILASVPMTLFSQYIPANYPWNYMPDSRLITKRSEDGAKIVGTVFHTANYFPQGSGRMFSTFVYDIASKMLSLKVENSYLNTGFYLTTTEDVDDNGNYFYKAEVANPTKDTKVTINKITPAGISIYKTGFLNNSSSLLCLRMVSNKLIIACGTSGNSYYTDARGKGTMVIAIED